MKTTFLQNFLKFCFFILFSIPVGFSGELFAQLSYTGSSVTIDFSTTITGVNNGAFDAGDGGGDSFATSPSAGQLDADGWKTTGWGSGDCTGGATSGTKDFGETDTDI